MMANISLEQVDAQVAPVPSKIEINIRAKPLGQGASDIEFVNDKFSNKRL